MTDAPPIRNLLLDIGGVLLTDGWGRHSRAEAVSKFGLDAGEMEDRHLLTWNTYQEGKIGLDDYLDYVVFHKPRAFGRDEFRDFVFAQTQPYQDMLDLIAQVKARHRLKICVLSNEGRELNAHRIEHFALTRMVDLFVSSCFVGMLKPDIAMYQMALEIGQLVPEQTAYIENTALFVDVAEGLGIKGIWHRNAGTTRAALASLGLD